MTTERHLLGPRPGAHGFGSFCRNKRTSARGAETPQEPLSFCHSRKLFSGKSQGRSLCFCLSSPTLIGDPVSFSSRMTKEKTLDPRLLMSRMTEGGEARMTEGGKARMTEGGEARMTEGGKARIAEGEGNRRMDPRLLMSRMTEREKARMTEREKARMTEGGKARIAEGEGNRRMDPRLLMSRMTEGGEGEDDRRDKRRE